MDIHRVLVVINIRLYECEHEQVKLRKKRWNNTLIQSKTKNHSHTSAENAFRSLSNEMTVIMGFNGLLTELYECEHEQVKLRKKRWNNKDFFLLKIQNVNM
jgi:hypothetical protein